MIQLSMTLNLIFRVSECVAQTGVTKVVGSLLVGCPAPPLPPPPPQFYFITYYVGISV